MRVVYSDESGTGGNLAREPHTVVTAILLDMDCQWIPVRDAVEAALKECYGFSEGQLSRYVIKGRKVFQKIERGDPKAKELMARLMAIPQQQHVPVWYGAVDRGAFKYQMENIHINSTFAEKDRPFMFALEECMYRVDAWVHSSLREHQVIWIHDEGSLNERARETLRGFRWLQKESELDIQFENLAIMPDVHISHIADMVYFGDDQASRLIQLSDACCHTIARWLRDDPTAAPYYQLLRSQVKNDGTRPTYEGAFKTVKPIRDLLAKRRAKES
jgi:hypothetical protein